MSDNDFREVIDGEENKEPTASDNNLHTTDAESAEVVTGTTEEKVTRRRMMSTRKSATSVTDQNILQEK